MEQVLTGLMSCLLPSQQCENNPVNRRLTSYCLYIIIDPSKNLRSPRLRADEKKARW